MRLIEWLCEREEWVECGGELGMMARAGLERRQEVADILIEVGEDD